MLQFQAFSVCIGIPKLIGFLSLMPKTGSDCCALPLKRKRKAKGEIQQSLGHHQRTHPGHHLFDPLPSGKHYRLTHSNTDFFHYSTEHFEWTPIHKMNVYSEYNCYTYCAIPQIIYYALCAKFIYLSCIYYGVEDMV